MEFSIFVSLISTFCLPFTTGIVSFGSFPSATEVIVGQDAHLVWIYSVDDRSTEFSSNSPTWDVYNSSTGSWLQIASESKYATPPWKWSITTATCPPTLRERLTKLNGSLATLVIKNVVKADEGRYRCQLQRTAGGPLIKEVKLTVLVKEPTTTIPSTIPASATETTIEPTTKAEKTCLVEVIVKLAVTFINIPSKRKDWLLQEIKKFFDDKYNFCDILTTDNQHFGNESTPTKEFTILLTLTFETKVEVENVKKELLVFKENNKGKVNLKILSVGPENDDDDDKLNIGAILGGGFGGVGVLAICVVTYVIVKKKKGQKKTTANEMADSEMANTEKSPPAEE